MTDQIEETLDDEQDISSDNNVETDDKEQEGLGEDNTTPNKNKSNFKALYKSNKEKEAQLKETRDKLEQMEAELEEWRTLNPEVAENLTKNKDLSGIEMKIFGIENPEAKPHLKEINKTMEEYGIDLDKAWKLVKMDMPEESKSKTDFDIGKKALPKNKDFTKISAEDALKLSKEDQSKWRKINWGV